MTSLPQTWHQARGEKIGGQQVTCHGYKKLYNAVRSEMPDPGDSLAAVAPESMILPALLANATTSKAPTRFGLFPKGSVVAVQQRMDSACIMKIVS